MNRKNMLKRLKAGEDPLELSIEKWQDIVDGKGKNTGNSNCALCHTNDEGCSKCPAKTCGYGSFYVRYLRANDSKQRKELAKQELKYLQSLRKESS